MNAVEIQGVSQRYGSMTVLHDLNLTLAEGEVLGLFGHNGAGKTTSMKLILGLLAPSEGQVKVLGRAPNDPREVRRRQREAERLAKEAAEAEAKAAAEQPLASPEIVASEPVVDTQPELPVAQQAADAQPEQTIEPVPAQQQPAVEQQSTELVAEQVPADDASEHKPVAPALDEAPQPAAEESEQPAQGTEPDNREKPQG